MLVRQTGGSVWRAIKGKWAAAMAVMGAMVSGAAYAVNDLPGGPLVNGLNLQPAASKIMEELHWLNYFILTICVVIFVVVFGVMFYSILHHRRSRGHQAKELAEPLWVELGWTIVPFLIVIGMALPATKVLVAQKDTSNADITVKVTGMQWKWGYDYIKGEGEGIGFLSTLDNSHRILSNSGQRTDFPDDYLLKVDRPLVVPVGKKVRVITTATDVIHAWYVPRLGIKQDAIPGFVRDNWFKAEVTGDFYGQCAELCGKEHAYMPIQVKVLSQKDYSAWVDEQKKAMAALADDPNKVWEQSALIERGAKVYAANCAACHQANGKGAGPILPLDGSAIVLDANTASMATVLLQGRNNGAMPAWNSLSDTELAAVMTYTKNTWSNRTGQTVQPKAVSALRGQ